MLVLGLDEAGYGPLLGPLVIAVSAWRVGGLGTSDDPGAALGERLRPFVVPARGRRSGGALPVPVDDSKRLYARDGLVGLARAVGAFAAASDQAPPADLGDLLARYGEGPPAAFGALPWHESLEGAAVPRYPWTGPLSERFASVGVEALDLRAWPIDVPAFNDATRRGSKANVLAVIGGCLLTRLLDRFPGEDAHVVFDRHGGRRDYRSWLASLFPFASLHEERRDALVSRYRLELPDRRLAIAFKVRADGEDLAVAWASVHAKLTRELFMERFNAWFADRCPGVRPTAGYVVDGRRFLEDVDAVLARSGVPRDWVVRAK